MIPLLLTLFGLFQTPPSGNFAVDLYGVPDTRPGCWGYADSQEKTITFWPPSGLRVHITRLRGDLVAWVRSSPTGAPMPLESN